MPESAACYSATAPRDAFETTKEPPIEAKTFFAAGQLAESQGRLPDAVVQYKKAIAAKADYADAIFRLGIVYTQQKDFTHAIETWENYISTTGGGATGYSNLGFCQEVAGNPSAAETAYKEGISKDPRNEPCHVNYGLMLARHGKPNEALLQLQTVLTPAQAHYDLASVYESQNRRLEARAEYRKAIALDPQFDEAKTKLAALEDN